MLRLPALATGLLITLLIVPLAAAQPPYYSPLVDFEGDIGSPDLHQEMFRIPGWNVTTEQFIVPNPPDSYTENAAFRDDELVIAGDASLRVYFEWVDPADPVAWLRLSTYQGEIWPNPSVHTGGKIHLKVTNQGDFFEGAMGICLGIRETGNAVPMFENGGVDGDIEWVGAIGTAGSGDDIRPIPAYTLPVTGQHIELTFDLATGHIWVATSPSYIFQDMGGGIYGMTGDGAWDVTRGTLEHIALVNVASDSLAEMQIYFDDIQAEAPDPDPVFPPTVQPPIINGDTTVTVADLLSTVDEVTLYRDGDFVQTLDATGLEEIEFTIAPAAATGECFTATQRESVSGQTSIESDPVCALPAAAVYTFNVCLDEDGSNCSTRWEMVPAASKATAPNGQVAPHGQIIFPNSAVWQTIDIPFDMPGLVTPWLGGDGVIQSAGTGVFSFDSMWFTSLGGPDAQGTHEVFLDSVEALDDNGDVIATIYAFDDGVNQMANTRSQANSAFTTSGPSTLASYAGPASHRFVWSFNTTTIDDTVAAYCALGWACGTAPTFPDTTDGLRVRLLARAGYDGTAPLPAVVGPIVGNQTGVRVSNDATATELQLYVDGDAVGDPVLPAGPETDFTDLALTPGQSVSVTQRVAGELSDYAYPVPVRALPDTPAVSTPIAPGSTEVTVTGVTYSEPHAVASLVEVYVNGGFAGDAVPTSDTVVVTVPALASGVTVTARQEVNGVFSDFSVGVNVALPAPVIYYVPTEGDEVVIVTAIDPNADTVTATVDGTDYTVAYDPQVAPFEVPTAALSAGQEVVATYTVGLDPSAASDAETVTSLTYVEMFCDNFEYANQLAFDAVWSPVVSQVELSEDANTTIGGFKSGYAPTEDHRSSAGYFTGTVGTDLEPAIFSINILDPTGGPGVQMFADVNDLQTDWFLTEIGMYASSTHYQCRLHGNGGPDWFVLDEYDAPTRSVGWHNFTVVYKGPPAGEDEGHELDIYVDGKLCAKNVTLSDTTTLREPRIGGNTFASGSEPTWFDDYCVYNGPLAFPDLPAPPPTLTSPIEAGDETVTISGVIDDATLVTVYANDGFIGSVIPAGANVVDVPVTALVLHDEITATQSTAALGESIASRSLEVGNGNGPLYLSIGVRETGDTGPLGSPGSTASADIEWIGTTSSVSGAPRGMRVTPQAGWQTVEFDPSQVVAFFGDGTIDETRGTLEHLAVAVDSDASDRSAGAYRIYIDNVVNVGAGPGGTDFLITDFEGFPLGDETLFQEPGNSGSTNANNVYPPDYSATAAIGNPGQSQELGWFWIDTQPQRWQRISTGGTANVNSPIIDLTRPIRLDILILERCLVPGDVNGDGVLDALDITGTPSILDCMNGPDVASGLDCYCADGNGDGDVDLRDIFTIQGALEN
jgi:hypothetical protein